MLNKLSLSTAFAGATILSVATVFGSVNVANAATFGFSFSNKDGSITQYPAQTTLNGEDIVPGFTLQLSILL